MIFLRFYHKKKLSKSLWYFTHLLLGIIASYLLFSSKVQGKALNIYFFSLKTMDIFYNEKVESKWTLLGQKNIYPTWDIPFFESKLVNVFLIVSIVVFVCFFMKISSMWLWALLVFPKNKSAIHIFGHKTTRYFSSCFLWNMKWLFRFLPRQWF